tara:strand:- start:7067 stop:9052 length:1986 start_codon:yes stop_codon:yes gene_type:complete
LKNKSVSLENLANCIRFLSMDAVQKAKSGHPGMPMGMADIATILFKYFLKFDPNDPIWPDRDRLIISNGHGSMLLYSCLYLLGYKNITINEIKKFRKLNSITAGHPEYDLKSGIETTTGPLSQGLSNAVGMALSERLLNNKFGNKIVNHYTYVFVGDGCLMEGLSHEAASLAGHLQLNKLIVFFDNNSISIDGPTNLSVSDNHLKRFEAQGWSTLSIDGHDHDQIKKSIIKAKQNKRPTLISCKTKIGFGSPNKEGKSSSHGSPLGEEEILLTRKNLNWEYKPFFIPKEFLNEWSNFKLRNKKIKNNWEINLKKSPKKQSFINTINGKLPKRDIINEINKFKKMHSLKLTECATRKSSELVIELLHNKIDNLVGGSADLTGSNNTKVPSMKQITKTNFSGNYLYYGVREHGMASIMNGMSLHKGIIPYGGTFLVFTDYCRPSIRLASLMKTKVIYIMTHDSIGLGEDGPTHQPVEHLSSLRSIPNLNVFRPADTIETVEAWQTALFSEKNPSVIVLTRQNLPLIRKKNLKENMVSKGAYIIKNFTKYNVTIFATGSELSIALEASKVLEKYKIFARVISLVCWELFDKQTSKYKKNIIGNKECYAIEASNVMGWHKYVREENFIGMKSFGKSAPYQDLYKYFGITSNNLVKLILKKNNRKK